jgi:hypothetical protein
MLARFMSADTIVPDPSDPQTLNRYSYCRNNPVMYVDPSGHDFGLSILIGMAIGALMSGMQSDWDPGAMAIGAGIGAISGGVASGVASATTSMLTQSIVETTMGEVVSTIGFGTANIAGAAAGGAAGGMVAGGLSSAIYGGNVLEGMAYGALGGAVLGGAMGAIGYYGRGLQSNAYDFGSSVETPESSLSMYPEAGVKTGTQGYSDTFGGHFGKAGLPPISGEENTGIGGKQYAGGFSLFARPVPLAPRPQTQYIPDGVGTEGPWWILKGMKLPKPTPAPEPWWWMFRHMEKPHPTEQEPEPFGPFFTLLMNEDCLCA